MADADKHRTPAMPDHVDQKLASESLVTSGRGKGGESGGGAYPNPHTGKADADKEGTSHGGQTIIGYHGKGQLGDQELGRKTPDNAGAKKG